MKQRNKPRQSSDEPARITKAVTHIRLIEANPGKLAALDALAPVFLSLCQQYVMFFCTEEHPDREPTASRGISNPSGQAGFSQA